MFSIKKAPVIFRGLHTVFSFVLSALLLSIDFKKPHATFGILFRGMGSNHRPSGYEPDKLPLLYPRIQSYNKSEIFFTTFRELFGGLLFRYANLAAERRGINGQRSFAALAFMSKYYLVGFSGLLRTFANRANKIRPEPADPGYMEAVPLLKFTVGRYFIGEFAERAIGLWIEFNFDSLIFVNAFIPKKQTNSLGNYLVFREPHSLFKESNFSQCGYVEIIFDEFFQFFVDHFFHTQM
jgi:hypothetical protein